jgi:hypothetical protein
MCDKNGPVACSWLVGDDGSGLQVHGWERGLEAGRAWSSEWGASNRNCEGTENPRQCRSRAHIPDCFAAEPALSRAKGCSQ